MCDLIVRSLMLALFLNCTYGLVQQCNQLTLDVCPIQSECSERGYCACETGYVADCSIAAKQAVQGDIELTIGKEFSFVQIVPVSQSFLVISFAVCNLNEITQDVLALWFDDGRLSSIDEQYDISSQQVVTLAHSACFEFDQVLRFGIQPNGESESLVFGVRGLQETTHKLMLKITQKEIFSLYFFLRLGMVLLIAFMVCIVGSIGYCCYNCRFSRRHVHGVVLSEQSHRHNIDYFNECMPTYTIGGSKRGEDMCSICLNEFTKEDIVRKTLCDHVFHADCLDSWCVKTLNCPFCRAGLDQEAVQSKNNKMLMQAIQMSLAESITPASGIKQLMI